MKQIIYFGYLIVFLCLPISSIAKIENNIILKIENEIITNYEIKNKILTTLMLANQELSQSNINNLKKRALDSIINFKLKKIELSNYDFKNDDIQLNSYLNQISSNDIKSLKKKFTDNNIDYEAFIDELQTEFKWQKFIYNIYSKKIKLNEKTIEEELEKIIKNRSDIIELELGEIEIVLNNNELDAKNISKIQNEIKTKGFENTAINYSFSTTSSKKGYIGWVNSKSLSNKVYKIIKNMEIGETSKPIYQQNSILFLNLINKRTSKVSDINRADLRVKIINQKQNDLFNLYARSHLSKLKNNAFIEYK